MSRPPSNWARLWPYLRPDAGRFGLALLLIPLISSLGATRPLVLKHAMDTYIAPSGAVVVPGSLTATLAAWLPADPRGGLLWTAAAYLAVVVGSFLVEGVYTVTLALASESSIYRLRRALFEHVLGLNQRFFERQPTGQILTRATSDVDALSEALAAGSVSIVLDAANMAFTLAAMFWLDPWLTLVLLLLGPPLAGLIEFFRRRMRVLFAAIRDALAALNAYCAERLAGVEVLQLFNQEERAAARFRALDEKHRDANVANNVYDAALYALIDGIASITLAVMLWYGARAAGVVGDDARSGVTVGLVVAFSGYIDDLFRPLRELSGKITFLQRAGAALDKIFWLLSVEERITPGTRRIGAVRGRLELDHVSFRYDPQGPEILHDVSLVVEPGEVVAVVGRTGSGKSTLVRILARVHDGYEGSIRVDGEELRELAPADVRRAVGSVRQDVQLFTESLRFNVTLGDPALDPRRVEEAVELSNASVIAARRPEGLEAPVRDRGANLSAGEAQILALARTLARDPAIVTLDEATASVDPLSERLLQEAIERVFARKTCIVVAHRLSTIVRADRIVVLEGGRVVEQGSHQELLAKAGRYAELYHQGFAGEGAEPPAEQASR